MSEKMNSVENANAGLVEARGFLVAATDRFSKWMDSHPEDDCSGGKGLLLKGEVTAWRTRCDGAERTLTAFALGNQSKFILKFNASFSSS